jgi:hypothetical protein
MRWGRSRVLLACLILILLLAGLPIIGALGSGVIAYPLGCPLDKGSVHPCPFLGADLGELLYAFLVLGWLSVLTVPGGAIQFLVWLIAAAVLTIRAAGSSRGR